MVSPYFARMGLLNVNPSAGWKINERVAVGAGLDLFLSTLEFRQLIPWGSVLGIPGLPAGEARVETAGAGLGANAGLTKRILYADSLHRNRVMFTEYFGDGAA